MRPRLPCGRVLLCLPNEQVPDDDFSNPPTRAVEPMLMTGEAFALVAASLAAGGVLVPEEDEDADPDGIEGAGALLEDEDDPAGAAGTTERIPGTVPEVNGARGSESRL